MCVLRFLQILRVSCFLNFSWIFQILSHILENHLLLQNYQWYFPQMWYTGTSRCVFRDSLKFLGYLVFLNFHEFFKYYHVSYKTVFSQTINDISLKFDIHMYIVQVTLDVCSQFPSNLNKKNMKVNICIIFCNAASHNNSLGLYLDF